MQVALKYVWRDPKTDILYVRTRRGGTPRYIRLPKIDAPDFAAEYTLAKNAIEAPTLADKPEPDAGSFEALIREFRQSTKYKETREVTQRNTDRYLDLFSARFGHRQVANLSAQQVDKLLDEMSDRPGTAMNYAKTLRSLINLGIRRGYCSSNPAVGTQKAKLGERQPWPEDVLCRAVKEASPMLRLAIITGLCSGQRISDCVLMKHSAFEADILPLVQQKTKVQVFIPIHPLWQSAMDAMPRLGERVLYNRYGKPFTTSSLQERLHRLMIEIGAGEYSFHGLRKNSTNFLAQLGASPHQISAINGMDLTTVQHYTRAVERRRLAESLRDRIQEAIHMPESRGDRLLENRG